MAIKINNTIVIDDNRNISSVGIATIGSGNSATTINGNTGIVNVGTGITIQGILGNISIAGTLTASGLNIPPTVTTFSPAIGATNVSGNASNVSNIDLTFNQWVGVGTTGTVVFREGSLSGVGINTLTVSAASTISRYQLRFTYNSNSLSAATTYFPVFSPQLITSSSGQFLGINTGSGPSYSFKTAEPLTASVNPANGATNVGLDTSITLTFSSTPQRGIGTVSLRSDSSSGPEIESFDAASSAKISVSGNQWILKPTNNLALAKTYYTIIPQTAIINYPGLNVVGANTHSFTTIPPNLGQSYEGGRFICQSSGVRWISAPSTSEVTTTWYNINTAATCAQQVSGCTGWFIPSCGQLQNPGFSCRTYWDSYTAEFYWSSSQRNGYDAYRVSMSNGSANGFGGGTSNQLNKTDSLRVRAFRCVTY